MWKVTKNGQSPVAASLLDEALPFKLAEHDVLVSRTAAADEHLRNKIDSAQAEKKQQIEREPEASYVIEVMFGPGFRMHAPVVGMVSLWGCGAIGGRGQNKLYFCPENTCGAILPLEGMHGNKAICPACGQTWKSDKLVGERLARLPVRKWAEVVAELFRKTQMRSDIYVKYHMDDLRDVTALERVKQTGGELIENALARTKGFKFSMMQIMREVSVGADLVGCILHRLTP